MVLIPRCALFKISQLKICADALGETGVTCLNTVAILQIADRHNCSMLKQERDICSQYLKENKNGRVSWYGSKQIYLADSFFTQEMRKLQKLLADLDVEEVWTLG